MMYEYICISAQVEPKNQDCTLTTVSSTIDIPEELCRELEKISCFSTPGIACDPVVLSSMKLLCGNEEYPFLSHVSPSTDGEERVAHHLVFRNTKELEMCPGMAPGVLRCDNFCVDWELLPEKLPLRMHLKARKRLGHRAYLWEALLGDAGWAGVVAERFLAHPDKPLYLEFSPEYIDSYGLLELFGEVYFLLPESVRADFTFTTVFTGESENCSCFLRAVPSGSPLLEKIREQAAYLLKQDAPGEIPQEYAASPLVKAAREMKPELPSIPLASTLAATEEPPEFSPEEAAPLLSVTRKVPTLKKHPLPGSREKKNWILYIIAIFLTALLFLLVYFYIQAVNSTQESDVIILRENMRIH
ncbi:MAG: hypothetical protein J6C40_07890 [Lentisphaeria bacterium]|nr:hypothetical protein [Lentisphaeria bacterium]